MPVLYSFMHYVTREIMLQRKLLFTQKDLIRQDGFHYKNTCPNTHPINQRKNYLSKLSLYSEPCSRLCFNKLLIKTISVKFKHYRYATIVN